MKKIKIAEGYQQATQELLEREFRLKGNYTGTWDYEFSPIYDNLNYENFVYSMVNNFNDDYDTTYRYSYEDDILYLIEESEEW